MVLYLLEFGEEVCDRGFEHVALIESRQTGPGGFKARKTILLTFLEFFCVSPSLVDFEMFLYQTLQLFSKYMLAAQAITINLHILYPHTDFALNKAGMTIA